MWMLYSINKLAFQSKKQLQFSTSVNNLCLWFVVHSTVSYWYFHFCVFLFWCESWDNVSHTTHRPNVLTAYFLMRGKTQYVCGVKSMICQSSSISCAVHSHRVLLTQNKDGSVSLFVKLRTAHRSDSRTLRWKAKSQRIVIFLVCQMCTDGEG